MEEGEFGAWTADERVRRWVSKLILGFKIVMLSFFFFFLS